MPQHPPRAAGSHRDPQCLQLSPFPLFSKVNASEGFILAGCVSSPLRNTKLDLEAPCHSIPLQHQGWAGPWAQEGWWSCCPGPACHSRDRAYQDSGSSPGRAWAQHEAGPCSLGNRCHFHLLLPGREGEGRREEQRRELAVKHPDVMLLTEQIRSF